MNQQFSGEFKETLKLTNTSELLEVLVEEAKAAWKSFLKKRSEMSKLISLWLIIQK